MSAFQLSEIQNINNDGAKESLLPIVNHPKSIQNNAKTKDHNNDSITFSEALEKAKFGNFNYFVIIISGLVMTNVILEPTSVAFYMTVAHCDIELTDYRKGLISAISYMGMIFSAHLWGFLADTQGRRKVMCPTLLAGFFVTLLSSFAKSFWLLLALRFINGICICGATATIYAYLGEFHTDATRGRSMMVSSFIFSLGSLCMPFLSYFIINQDWRLYIPFLDLIFKPWRLFMIVCAVPGLISGIAMYFLPESPKFLMSQKREDEAIAVLQEMYRSNGGSGNLEVHHIKPEEDCIDIAAISNKNIFNKFLLTMWNQTVPLFQRKYLRTTLIVCIIQFWMFVVGVGMYMWFPYIINAMGEFMNRNPDENQLLCKIVRAKQESIYNTDNGTAQCIDKLEKTTYMYSLLLEILFCVFFAFIGLIINCVGKTAILFITIILFSSCGLVALWLPITNIAAIFYVLMFLVGAAINILTAVTVELYPTQLRALALSVSLMIGRLGSVISTNIIGALLATHCDETFYISCFAMMSCAILILFLPKAIEDSSEASKSKPEQIS